MSSEEYSKDILRMRSRDNLKRYQTLDFNTEESGPGKISKKDLEFIIKSNPKIEHLLKRCNFDSKNRFGFQMSYIGQSSILKDVLQGMISKYNEEDIEYFVKNTNLSISDFAGWENKHSDEYKNLLEKIKIKIPSADFHWIPSMYTLEKIYAQIS